LVYLIEDILFTIFYKVGWSVLCRKGGNIISDEIVNPVHVVFGLINKAEVILLIKYAD
jgi:hypothetical protein